MHNTSLHNPVSFRFRRWSRAGYAVFCSLGSNVTIGCLVGSIAEKALYKSEKTSSCSIITLNADDEFSETENEISDLETTLKLVQLENLSEIAFDSAAARGRVNSYIFNHHSG